MNAPERDPQIRQIVKVEICEDAFGPCSDQVSFPFGFSSQCKQKYAKKKLLSLDARTGQLDVDSFFIPSCCVCQLIRQPLDVVASDDDANSEPVETRPRSRSRASGSQSSSSSMLASSSAEIDDSSANLNDETEAQNSDAPSDTRVPSAATSSAVKVRLSGSNSFAANNRRQQQTQTARGSKCNSPSTNCSLQFA